VRSGATAGGREEGDGVLLDSWEMGKVRWVVEEEEQLLGWM
jgi:hypothetical protein